MCERVCEHSYLLWSPAAGASEEAQPFLPVPFTLSQHTVIKLCSSVQHIERKSERETERSDCECRTCVCDLIDTVSFLWLTQSCFLPRRKQGAIEGKIRETAEVSRKEKWPRSSRGYWDSGWAGALHGGPEEGHVSTPHSAPGIRFWQAAIPLLPLFTLFYPSSAQQQVSFH